MAQRVVYRDTGFEYVKGSEKVLFSNGVCLTVDEYSRLDQQNVVIREILQRAKDGAQLYDFEYAAKEGVLREIQHIPERPNTAPHRPMLRPAPKKEIPEPTKTTLEDLINAGKKDTATLSAGEIEALITSGAADDPLPELSVGPEPPVVAASVESVSLPLDTPVEEKTEQQAAPVPYWRTVPFIVETAMALVAIGAGLMSIYHTTAFLVMSGKPLWTGLTTGIIMILFSATAFTAGRYFLMEKGLTKLFGPMFILLGIVIVSYSAFSTITVNYNQFQWQEAEETDALIENSAELALANEQKELLYAEVERLDGEIARLEAEADGWRNQSWRLWESVTIRLDAVREQRQAAWEAYMASGEARSIAESDVAQSRPTVYEFVASLLGIPAEITRFFMLTASAIFFDLIAPLGVAVTLLLEEKRRQR